MENTSSVALLKVNGHMLIPTELHRVESLHLKTPQPGSFQLSIEGSKKPKNYYRRFKNDLLLGKRELQTPSGEIWEMETKKSTDNIGEWTDDSKSPFNPLDATSVFLEKVCTHAVKRARQLFGHDQDIRVHFTAPNYAFEDESLEESKQKSSVFRRNFRNAVARFESKPLFSQVTFKTGGYDFLYEPYAVFYHYSILENGVKLSDDQAGKTYLVFDMGGSTTDVSIVQVNRQESDFRLYPIGRSIKRAGAYFDRYILGDLLGYGQAVRRDAKKWNDTLQRVEQAKIALCEGRSEKEKLKIEGNTYTLTPGKLATLLRDLWKNDNLRLGQAFRGFIGDVQALVKDHGQLLDFNEIEKVFLAGGSIGLPGIEDLIREDLERLELLGDGPMDCVHPAREDSSGNPVMPSGLAALGQSASIAEENSDFMLEEYKDVFARLEDKNGRPYSFEREKREAPKETRDDEMFLLSIDEFGNRDKLRFESTDFFDKKRLSREDRFPERFDLYVRAGANDYSEEPNRVFYGRDEAVKAAPEEAHALQFKCIAESKSNQDLKLRPTLWYRLLQSEKEERYHDDIDPLHVSLKRGLIDGDVHICVDFGMTNTVVSVHAPGRSFPENADDLEAFPLTPESSVPDQQLLVDYLPGDKLSEQGARRGIRACCSEFADSSYPDLYWRWIRGAHVARHVETVLQETPAQEPEKVIENVVRLLRNEASVPTTLSMVREEVDVFRRMLHEDGGLQERALDSVREVHQHEHAVSFDQLKQLSRSLPLPDWPSPTTENDSENSDSSSPDTDMSSDDTSHKSALSHEMESANGHWTEGLANWIDERVKQSASPLQESTEKVDEALAKLGKIADSLESASQNTPDQVDDGSADRMAEVVRSVVGPISDTLDDIAESLSSRVEDGDEDNEKESQGQDGVAYFDKEISDAVEGKGEHQSPLSQPAVEDTSFEAFKSFIKKRDWIYSEDVLRQVWTRCTSESGSLIILAGPPGSGKSSLVRLLAEFFNRSSEKEHGKSGWDEFYHLQPVSPSWFSPDDLLGSFSTIQGRFQETAFLRFLMKAEVHYYEKVEDSRTFFACLDEFNIAQPEQYLADLLSKMEAPTDSGRMISLCPAERLGPDREGDLTVELTPNLRLFATINTDVSTKTLSPKVLDRAFFLRLTPDIEELQTVADLVQENHEVYEQFHTTFRDEVLLEVDKLARAGQSPLGFRAIEQAYAYARSHPGLKDAKGNKAVSDVIGEVLTGFFLSKLPGVFSVDDPEAEYSSLIDETDLRQYKGVKGVLGNLQSGLPGQAAL